MSDYLIVMLNTVIILVLIKLFFNLFALTAKKISALFPNRRKKPATMGDLIMSNETMKFFSELHTLMQAMSKEGTDLDEIPEGIGEFGHDITNPIPVNTIFGNTSYLNRLRTADGKEIRYERLGSGGAENIDGPIDIYDIFCGSEKIATLYIHPYNRKDSEKAPKGFKLIC